MDLGKLGMRAKIAKLHITFKHLPVVNKIQPIQ